MNPQVLIILALLAPFVGAIFALASYTKVKVSASFAFLALLVSTVASVALMVSCHSGQVFALHVGGWEAPYGIVLVADGLTSIMLVACQLVGLVTVVFCYKRLEAFYSRRFLFPLLLTLMLGANGAFLTGDLFNLYVWFEVLLLSSFAIMTMSRGIEGRRTAWNYVVINLISSMLFLVAAGLIYGNAGTLNFAELRLRFEGAEDSFMITSSAALLFGAFGIKSALIPLAFWLPGSYPKLPAPLVALFAGILTKVGLYAFFRVFGMVFSDGQEFLHQDVLLVVANITMIGGVLGAIAQKEMKKILSFHIISQVGYMALALAIYTPAAIAAGVFYLAHHIVVKANLFFATDMVQAHAGSTVMDKKTGVLTSSPLITVLFAISALSLAGLPPLSGFFAKFGLLKAAAANGSYVSLAIAVLVGVFTLFSMLKIWRGKFWGDDNTESRPAPMKSLVLCCLLLSLVTITVGLAAEPLFRYSIDAAAVIIEPTNYYKAVLQKP